MQIFAWTVRTAGARQRLGALRSEIGILAQDLPERAAEVAVAEARGTDRWKDRTGKTRDSITARQVGPYRWRFRAGGVSQFLNYGTGLQGPKGQKYPITSSSGKLLHFFWAKHNKWVTTKKVMHPGVPKTLFVDIAKNKAEDFMLARFYSEVNAAIKAHNS